MSFLVSTRNTKTSWDRLLDRELAIERLRYELDAPLWYWTPQEWNLLEYQLVKELAARDRISREYDSRDYPSCNIPQWWLY